MLSKLPAKVFYSWNLYLYLSVSLSFSLSFFRPFVVSGSYHSVRHYRITHEKYLATARVCLVSAAATLHELQDGLL